MKLAVRFLDNVIDANKFPLKEVEEEAGGMWKAHQKEVTSREDKSATEETVEK